LKCPFITVIIIIIIIYDYSYDYYYIKKQINSGNDFGTNRVPTAWKTPGILLTWKNPFMLDLEFLA